MRKKVIAVLMVCVIAAGGLLVPALLSNNQAGTVHLQAAQADGENMTIAELQQAIEELRALVNLLVLNMNNNAQQDTQAGIPSISSQRARDIAVEFIGHGRAMEVWLFTDGNVLTFEVEVRHENVRYMVYINAANGNVIRMSRFEDGYQGITTLPEVVTPQPSPSPSPSP